MGTYIFNFFLRRHFATKQRASKLLYQAQVSLKSRAGNRPKSELACADSTQFPAQEIARICTAGE